MVLGLVGLDGNEGSGQAQDGRSVSILLRGLASACGKANLSSSELAERLYAYRARFDYVKKEKLNAYPRFTAENRLIVAVNCASPNSAIKKGGERKQREGR